MPQLIPQPEFDVVKMPLQVTKNQAEILRAIRENIVTIIHGPAGTGKTFIPLAEGFRMLLAEKCNPKIDHMVFVRPAVEAEEQLGFLPGTAEEKIEPYMAPLLLNAKKLLNGHSDRILKLVQPMTMAFIRGITFENCYVILDEAQNATQHQMKLFLSRIGKRCKVVVCGDTKQSDLNLDKRPGDAPLNGLDHAVSILRNIGGGIAVCTTTYDDNMRSPIVDKILRAYDGLPPTEAKAQFDHFINSTFGDPDDIKQVEYTSNEDGDVKDGKPVIDLDISTDLEEPIRMRGSTRRTPSRKNTKKG